MANIRSQIKRNRQNEKRRLRNKQVRSELKTRSRRVQEAIASGDADRVEAALRNAGKAFDKAAAKGVIHKNKAANAKSRLAKKVNRELS